MRRSVVILFGAKLLALSLTAQTSNVLHSFSGALDGRYPQGDLALNGNVLYGTTLQGGNSGNEFMGGTIFRINTDGSGYEIIKNFTNEDGTLPRAGLIASESTLYGTTSSGGSSYAGTIFRLNTNGSGYAILKSFSYPLNSGSFVFTNGDGAWPESRLILSEDTLYGTTPQGGTFGYGTVFRVKTNGTDYTVLKHFNSADGASPQTGVVLSDGRLYGTTYYGGISNSGTVFKVNTNGTGFIVLKTFTNSDGMWPKGGLVLSGTTLYGTTVGGGSWGGGTVYKLNTDGTDYAILKDFNGSETEYIYGSTPLTGLTLSGNTLYGSTANGGDLGLGNVFKLNTDGSGYSILKSFAAADGINPATRLVLSGGTLFGTTIYGGSTWWGTVFSVIVPPEILVGDDSFGVLTNRFGFNVTGGSNQVVVIEASTDLAAAMWTSLQTNTLDNGSLYFSDSNWTTYPYRFFRARVQ